MAENLLKVIKPSPCPLIRTPDENSYGCTRGPTPLVLIASSISLYVICCWHDLSYLIQIIIDPYYEYCVPGSRWKLASWVCQRLHSPRTQPRTFHPRQGPAQGQTGSESRGSRQLKRQSQEIFRPLAFFIRANFI